MSIPVCSWISAAPFRVQNLLTCRAKSWHFLFSMQVRSRLSASSATSAPGTTRPWSNTCVPTMEPHRTSAPSAGILPQPLRHAKHMKSHKPEDPADWRIEKTYLYLCYVWRRETGGGGGGREGGEGGEGLKRLETQSGNGQICRRGWARWTGTKKAEILPHQYRKTLKKKASCYSCISVRSTDHMGSPLSTCQLTSQTLKMSYQSNNTHFNNDSSSS